MPERIQHEFQGGRIDARLRDRSERHQPDVGLALADYEGPRYKRIEHLKLLLRTERLDQSLRWRLPAPQI